MDALGVADVVSDAIGSVYAISCELWSQRNVDVSYFV